VIFQRGEQDRPWGLYLFGDSENCAFSRQEFLQKKNKIIILHSTSHPSRAHQNARRKKSSSGDKEAKEHWQQGDQGPML
jgi:hypothetical protein